MLVLSRRQDEKIEFPTLGITVQVTSLNRNAVRLGITAPPSVTVVRGEIQAKGCDTQSAKNRLTRHEWRNRMHTANLAVHLAQKQLAAGRHEEADGSLAEALREFASLEQEFASRNPGDVLTPRAIHALLVEDNPNESALFSEFLRMHGIQAETACDGIEALDYLKSHDRPDFVLLDMCMPRCDGPTTVSAIRSNSAFAGLKVFAVSGADPRECFIDSVSLPVDGWFAKPIDPARLVRDLMQAVTVN